MISAVEQASLKALLTEYVALSRGMRFDEKRAYWDVEEPHPVLSPEESERCWVGWDEIEAYWALTKGALLDLESNCWGMTIQPVSSNVAIILFNLGWIARVKGLSETTPLGAHVRVTAALRRKQDGWKIFSYVEGHVDGLEFMRGYYRSQPRPNESGAL